MARVLIAKEGLGFFPTVVSMALFWIKVKGPVHYNRFVVSPVIPKEPYECR